LRGRLSDVLPSTQTTWLISASTLRPRFVVPVDPGVPMAQVTTKTATLAPATSPQRVLLHRRGGVYVEPGAEVVAASVPGVELLEADLLDLGWMLDAPLRDALLRVDPADLVITGSSLLSDCAALLGADKPHVPLFRNFPDSTP